MGKFKSPMPVGTDTPDHPPTGRNHGEHVRAQADQGR